MSAGLIVPLVLIALIGEGQVPTSVTVLQSVRVDAAGASAPSVVIEAGGPLPRPRVGVLDDPPRIYLDFAGVTVKPDAAGPDAEGVVRGVRAAIRQRDPLVTRVVIDLAEPVPHRLDASRREHGRVAVILDRAPGRSPRLPAGRDEAGVVAALAQLGRLRPLLSAIDSRIDVPEESLRAMLLEFDTIGQTLSVSRSDPSLEGLKTLCVLAKTAAAMRLDAQQHGDPAAAWNAASAAAGALILLDRATSELKLPPARK